MKYWKQHTNKIITPTGFKQSNKTLTKPRGMTDEECGSLPVFYDGKQFISCWSIPFWRRIRLLVGGKLWLGVVGVISQPPVWVSAQCPFIKEKKK